MCRVVRSSSALLVACHSNGMRVGILALLWPVPATARAQSLSPSEPPRASLHQAITELSVLSARTGIAQALATSSDSQVVVLWDGAPIVRGIVAAKRLVLAQRDYALLQVELLPQLVEVADDGQFGVSWGVLVARDGSLPTAPLRVGRYIGAWKRVGAEWRVVAFAPLGAVFPSATIVPVDLPSIPFSIEPRATSFARADSLFAALAGKQGAPAAFASFVALDGMTFHADGIAVGPLNVRARMDLVGAGRSQWEWKPVIASGAADGSLGYTVGEATIRGKRPDGSASIAYSKYLTIWRRQSDGSARFLFDGGNARPPVSR